jgi:hypothetical protein
MRLSAMGDVAMAVPKGFVNQYPEVKITVISRPFQVFLKDSMVFFCFRWKTTTKALGLFRLFEDVKKLELILLIYIMSYVLK